MHKLPVYATTHQIRSRVLALEVLLEAGYQPDMLIGSSVGAVNAAFLASDPTLDGVRRIKEICLDVRSQEVYLGHRSSVLWNIIRGRESLLNYRVTPTCQRLTRREWPN